MLRQQSQTRQAEGRQPDSGAPGSDGRKPSNRTLSFGALSPQLAHRTEGFRKVFDHLDRFDRPVGIVETGCVRQQDNWAGDGKSTILFNRYAEFHPRSAVFSVNRDPEAAALCRSLVGGHVRIQYRLRVCGWPLRLSRP